jgi:hypothetical protein
MQASKQTLVVSVSLSFSEKNTKTTEERKTLTEKERVQKERNGGKDCVIKERDGLFKG